MDIMENLRRKRYSIAEELIKTLAGKEQGQFILKLAARQAVQECFAGSFSEVFAKATLGNKDEAFLEQIDLILNQFPDACPGEI